MRNFKELKIWQKGIDIAVRTYQLADTFPKEDKFSIRSANDKGKLYPFLQILRKAAVERVRGIIQGLLKFLLVLHLNWKHKLLLLRNCIKVINNYYKS